jgi:predicted permease
LFRNQAAFEAEMTAEMRQHVDLQTALNRRAGLDPDEARYAALRQFGNVAALQETARAQHGGVWLEQLAQDLRFSLRGLGKSPGYAAVALLTLALGIGTTTAIFSIVYGVLLEPYPYAKSSEIWEPAVTGSTDGGRVGLRMTDYLEMAGLPGVASAMATGYNSVTLSGGLNPEIITAPQLTASAFAFLNVPPLLGRGLGPGDFLPTGDPQPVTVLSFRLWQRLFNGDPGVIGKTLVLDDQPYVIVGVMPPRFGWYTDDGLWLPLPTLDLKRPVRAIVRLKPGVSPAVAGEQLLAMLREQMKREPERFPKDGLTAHFNNYLDVTVASGAMRTSLFLLLGAVGFLLLIACTNVANLQLARGAGRARELAVRLALGAGRGRIGRQLLTESVVLAFAGGALGVLFAYGLLQVIVVLLPAHYVPNEARVTMNGWVLGFSTALSVFTGLAAGLVPAWQSTRLNANDALKDGGPAAGSRRGNRTRSALAVTQVMLSVMLVVGACLTTLGFLRAERIDRGFRTEKMLLLRVPLTPKRYPRPEQRLAFARDFTERLRALPGVAQVTLGLPPGLDSRSAVAIIGQPELSDGWGFNLVDADYLAAYGLALADGRYLTPEEIARGAPVALVSAAAAKLWANGASPLGHTVTVATLKDGAKNVTDPGAPGEVTIVGVLADVHAFGPLRPAPPAIFVAYTLAAPASRTFVLHALIEPAALLNAVRTELRTLDREQPMQQPVTFDEILADQVKQPRFSMVLFDLLAGIALTLAAAGIYSVLSYAVAQRSREIGVRMALGAGQSDVQRLFLRTGGKLVGFGLALGIAASVAGGRIVRSEIALGPWFDPLGFSLAILLLAAVGFLACLIPARRAAKVDPMVVLRAD